MKILIVVSDFTLRGSLALFFESHANFTPVGIVGSAQLALKLCRELQVDIILLDFHVRDMDAITAIQALRLYCPIAPIVVLANSDDVSQSGRMAEAGATGWLLKDTPVRRIANALRLAKYRGTATGS